MNASPFLLLMVCSLRCTWKTHLLLIIFETVFNIYALIANRSSQGELGPFVESIRAKEIFAQKYRCRKDSFCKLIKSYKQTFMWNLKWASYREFRHPFCRREVLFTPCVDTHIGHIAVLLISARLLNRPTLGSRRTRPTLSALMNGRANNNYGNER